MARVLFLVCAFFVSVRGDTLPIKGYFCQDPDTGLLHGVNTTWPSTTFCGNYTCKIKLRNQDKEQASSIIVNVTRKETTMRETNENEKQTVDGVEFNKEMKPVNIKELDDYIKSIHFGMDNMDDRFLNNEEIQKLSQLLPTVKKSDLEAIIEIYNLAQDIYNEMDSVPKDQIKENPNTMETQNLKSGKADETKNVDHISYWYEPLGFNGNNKQSDMKLEGSEFRPTSLNPYEVPYTPIRRTTLLQPQMPQFTQGQLPIPLNPQLKLPVNPIIPPQSQIPLLSYPPPVAQPRPPHATDSMFFTGTILSNRDFGRLAYYYPMSNLQKLAYYNQRAYEVPLQAVGESPPATRTPCQPGCRGSQHVHLFTDGITPYPPPHKPAETPVLLPFPFTYQEYNGSASPYYKGNPWAFYNYYKSNQAPYQPAARQFPKLLVKTDQPIFQTAPSPIPKVVAKAEMSKFNNEELNPVDNIEDGETLAAPHTARNEKKRWQTDPLEEVVIDEIRANIAERAKLLKLPIKKRIKLERVAKVIRLDHLNRHKRQADVASSVTTDSPDNNETYEVSLERMTCVSSTEPGFFRVGNLSEPFPACCPQKIEG